MKIKTFWNDIYEYDGTQIICSEMLLAECRQYIKNKLTRRELLEQLAEECSELTKAAMKNNSGRRVVGESDTDQQGRSREKLHRGTARYNIRPVYTDW